MRLSLAVLLLLPQADPKPRFAVTKETRIHFSAQKTTKAPLVNRTFKRAYSFAVVAEEKNGVVRDVETSYTTARDQDQALPLEGTSYTVSAHGGAPLIKRAGAAAECAEPEWKAVASDHRWMNRFDPIRANFKEFSRKPGELAFKWDRKERDAEATYSRPFSIVGCLLHDYMALGEVHFLSLTRAGEETKDARAVAVYDMAFEVVVHIEPFYGQPIRMKGRIGVWTADSSLAFLDVSGRLEWSGQEHRDFGDWSATLELSRVTTRSAR